MNAITVKPWTADELCRLPKGWRYEIDDGELVIMSPGGRRHGRTVIRIAYLLESFVSANRLGEVDGGEFGVFVRRGPLQVLRGIDVAFYGAERLLQLGDEEGFADVVPDLAVEVHLPDERDMQRKVDQYLAAGVRSVWVVDPRKRTLTKYHAGNDPVVLTDPHAVVTEPVLPGFECRLQEVFNP